MLAIATQFVIVGAIGIAIGWWTVAKADQLAEANAAIVRRFVPGRTGRILEGALGASTYRVAGILILALGACFIFGSLFI